MRCRACNAMISIRRSKYGGFEDMCSQCIGWSTATVIDSDFTRKDDSLPRQYSLSEALVVSELGLSIDTGDDYDNMIEMDRNHEVTYTENIFDKYED